jgi:hypothetical protein
MVNVKLFEDLDAVARDAAGGLDRRAQPCLHARLDWFRLLAAHCPPEGALVVARAEDHGDKAWLFLANGGAAARAYAQWYSLRFGLIGADRLAEAIAKRLIEKGLASVDLSPLARPEALAAAFRAAGWTTEIVPAAGNWVALTDGLRFDDYWAYRPSALRNTLKRKRKAAALDLEIHDRFDLRAWEAYEAVYRASWKPEEGSFPFLRALAEQEGAAGSLRLGIARHEGRPVAAQLWLVEDRAGRQAGICRRRQSAVARHDPQPCDVPARDRRGSSPGHRLRNGRRRL